MSLKESSVGEKVMGRSFFCCLSGGANGDGSDEPPLLPAGLSSFISEYEGFSNVVAGLSFLLNWFHFDSLSDFGPSEVFTMATPRSP